MPEPRRSVAVFCGSRPGADPAHAGAGLTLVYGGGGIGLMGKVAEAAIAAGGQVHGVIPEFLTRIERVYPKITELEVTGSMHSRKTRMYELSDAFIVLSGGLGTMDELMEVLTWRQLGLHDKPIILLDIAGWARPLVALFEHLIEAGFVAADGRPLFAVAADVPAAMALLRTSPADEASAPAERL
jgi:uncharacterized protein (TIGR00730 family)